MIQREYEKVYTTAGNDPILTTVDIANGIFLPDDQPDMPRNVVVTVSDGDTSISAGTITVHGLDSQGNIISESFDLSLSLTFTGTVGFATITNIVVSDLVGEDPMSDTLAVDTGEILQITTGHTILRAIQVGDSTGSADVQVIDNITGSTTNVALIAAGGAEGNYWFDCSIAQGIRIINGLDNPIMVIYQQL